MKSLKRLRDRPAGHLRDAVREVPGRRRVAGRPRVRRAASSRSSRSCSRKIVVVMGEDALDVLNDLDMPLSEPIGDARRRAAADPVDRLPLRPEHRRRAGRGGFQAGLLEGLQGAGRVVRGPAAVLVLVAAAWVYFVIPKLLPAIQDEETSASSPAASPTMLVVLVAASVGDAVGHAADRADRAARARRSSPA